MILTKKFPWENCEPAPEVSWVEIRDISNADLRDEYEKKMRKLIKEGQAKNEDQINAIADLLKISE